MQYARKWSVSPFSCCKIDGKGRPKTTLPAGSLPIEQSPQSLLFARLLLVRGNELVGVGDIQHSRAFIVIAAEGIDVPLLVGTVGLLHVSTNQVLFFAINFLTIVGVLAAELLPMLQPRTARARSLRRSVDILDFQVFLLRRRAC